MRVPAPVMFAAGLDEDIAGERSDLLADAEGDGVRRLHVPSEVRGRVGEQLREDGAHGPERSSGGLALSVGAVVISREAPRVGEVAAGNSCA